MSFHYQRSYRGPLQAAVLDWAGTVVDFGCCAPVEVFRAAFRALGVEVTEAEARAPMGMAKRDHFVAMVSAVSVRARFAETLGRAPTDADVDAMYEGFLPMMCAAAAQRAELIPGAKASFDDLVSRGIRVASTTGYTREILEPVRAAAAAAGYAPAHAFTASDSREGRPAPWLIFRSMEALGVHQTAAVVKVDDAVHGIEAGLNAGTWTVGVAASGNSVGLDRIAFEALTHEDRVRHVDSARAELARCGAHFVIDTIAELPAVITSINDRLQRGERP